MKKMRFWSVIALIIILLGGSFIGLPRLFSPAMLQAVTWSIQDSIYKDFDGKRLYKRAFIMVRDLHLKLDGPEKVEAFSRQWEHKFDHSGELDSEEGTDKAIAAMLGSLAERFDYALGRQDTSSERQRMDGSLSGIGAMMRLSQLSEIIEKLPKDSKPEEIKKAIAISAENHLLVEESIDGGPAKATGLLAGDIIRTVDGTDLNGMQMDEAVNLIKGPMGSTVVLGIERVASETGETEQITLEITRARVQVKVVSTRDLGNGTSYIKLSDFMSRHASAEMYEALKAAANGKGIIIDLRSNPGGELGNALKISAMLLEDGPVMLQRSRQGDGIVEHETSLTKHLLIQTAPGKSASDSIGVSTQKRPPLVIPADMPIVILVNEGSASASEIIAGMLQHNKRATIVGMTTLGKGVGQSVVPLPYGRSLHITSFEFIPGRTPNDFVGVIPDVVVKPGGRPGQDQQLLSAQEILSNLIEKAEATRELRKETFERKQKQLENAKQESQTP